MGKLQTFTIYLLIIVGFFLFSTFLEGKLIENMYVSLNGTVEENFEYDGDDTALDVEILDAKATRMNGYLKARVTNKTDKLIDKAYLKTDLFAKGDLKAISRYLEINDLQPGESKDYEIKLALKNDFPDEEYIFEIFGYEINTKSIFGLDLSDYIDAKAIKAAGFNGITSIFSFIGKVSHRFVVAAQSVPWWGYLGALAIIAGII